MLGRAVTTRISCSFHRSSCPASSALHRRTSRRASTGTRRNFQALVSRPLAQLAVQRSRSNAGNCDGELKDTHISCSWIDVDGPIRASGSRHSRAPANTARDRLANSSPDLRVPVAHGSVTSRPTMCRQPRVMVVRVLLGASTSCCRLASSTPCREKVTRRRSARNRCKARKQVIVVAC